MSTKRQQQKLMIAPNNLTTKSDIKLCPRSSKLTGWSSSETISPPKRNIGIGAQTSRNMNVIRSKFIIPVALPMMARYYFPIPTHE